MTNRTVRPPSDQGRVRRALDAAVARVLSTAADVGDRWPYAADPTTGRWETTGSGDWCDGHFIDALRIAGRRLDRDDLLDQALRRTERIRYKLELDDQFRGHRFYHSAARLHEQTGDPRMRTLALAAAYAVRSMAIPANGAMPIGHQVQVRSTTLASRDIVAIDNLHPNLILDWWALGQTGDETFLTGPRRHAEVVERHFLRPDGSTFEFIEFNPGDGAPRRKFTLLGKADDSCWSRGQAWAIAGCLLGYHATRDDYYIDLCTPMFDYWWNHTGPNPPPWDFADTRADAPLDTSASAIVTSALARAATDPIGAGKAARFLDRLHPMVDRLLAHTVGPNDPAGRPVGMLLDTCFNYPGNIARQHESIWGDLYLLDTLDHLAQDTRNG